MVEHQNVDKAIDPTMPSTIIVVDAVLCFEMEKSSSHSSNCTNNR
jgi:hypothetical protein